MEKIPSIAWLRTEKTFVAAAALLGAGALFLLGTTLLGQKQTELPTLPSHPTPAPMRQAGPQELQDKRVAALVQLALGLRESGDTATALIRLREAMALAPENPNVICEMALTYEKMGLDQKAAFQWERLVSKGEGSRYYALAQSHLRPVPAPEQTTPGVPPGSILGFLEMTLAREPDPSGAEKVVLKVPIKSRNGASIEARDVVIQVAFYDLLPDASVAQTSANVNYHWITPPTDWRQEGLELLAADYLQPNEDQKAGRKYFGYAVSLYYKNLLQDKKAEPAKLLEKFPAPVRLQPDGI